MRTVLDEDQTQPAVVDPTTDDIFDAFLRSRAQEVTGTTLARDREVIEWFRAYLEARDRDEARAGEVDELAERRLAKLGPAKSAATHCAERILQEITDFFGGWLPTQVQATALQRQSAGLVVRLLARWLLRCRLVDERSSREVHFFTQRFAPIPPAQRRKRYRPPGASFYR